jgi:glycine/D-amino acid oxidase-like deaminating enzyme
MLEPNAPACACHDLFVNDAPPAELEAEVVICGAGIAGIAVAYFLAVRNDVQNVVLVERDAPLAMTSDKSTECYRNWWPGPNDAVYGGAMVGLMNQSIDLLEEIARETGNRIHLNRRGYVYATADAAKIPVLREAALNAARFGAGPLRVHEGESSSYVPSSASGFEGQFDGADLILEPSVIHQHFPEISHDAVAVLHARRCGWFSAQQLGMFMLEQAREHGVRLVRGEVTGVEVVQGRVQSVRVTTDDLETTITTPNFVNAAGPLQNEVARMIGLELPVVNERHFKVYFNDHEGAIRRNAPMLIWLDETKLPWSEEERQVLEQDESTRWLLETFPSGVHCRPEGGDASTALIVLFNHHLEPVQPSFPLKPDPLTPELALRGMSVMLPGLRRYFDRAPKSTMDGGYYTKTPENRPLIGPLPVSGAFIVGALGGFGLMASCAAGELLAAHVTGSSLPSYARAFLPSRYGDPAYQRLLETWGDVGQL